MAERIVKGIRATLFLVAVVALCGCNRNAEKSKHEAAPVEKPPELEPFELPAGGGILDGVPQRSLKLDEPQRYLSCHEFFEPGEGITPTFPFESAARAARVMWGCGVEAHAERDGIRWIAYPAPIDPATSTRNLRVVRYDAAGKLSWAHTIDRSEQGRNFTANFRRSFVTPLQMGLVCAGTLWEGGTQTHCIEDATGEPKWTGWMPFWSGLEPQAGDDGLWVADLTALTKRYPYSGVEMKYRRLPDTGGRAALYATDGEALFFVPSRSSPPTLTAIEFDALRIRWHRKLPIKPIASFHATYPDQKLLVITVDQHLVGVDTETGAPLWGWEIGDDRPSVAMHGDRLLVVHRRPDQPNAVIAMEPRTGKRVWRSDLPSGVLEVHAAEGEVFFKSIRAIQRVTGGLDDAP